MSLQVDEDFLYYFLFFISKEPNSVPTHLTTHQTHKGEKLRGY